MTDCTSSHFSSNASWFKIVQLVSMETWDKSDLFTLIHNLGARLLFKEVFLAKDIYKNRWDLFILYGFLYGWYLALNYICSLLQLSLSFWYGMGATKCCDNCDLILILNSCNLDSLEHFYLILRVKTITWFNLNSCCAKLAHSG